MILVNVPEPDDPEWRAWRTRCDAATADLLDKHARGESYRLGDLYKGAKPALKRVFHNKCAYCEAPLAEQRGDVEHYRPKARVVEQDGKTRVSKREIDGSVVEHPGYFWLAYDWRNLLLSCQICNQLSEGGSGKGNRFPLRATQPAGSEFRAWMPGDERYEEPALLNPWIPGETDLTVISRHFKLDELGFLEGCSDQGRACINVLDLNRESLVDARRKTMQNVRDKFNLYMGKDESEEQTSRQRLEAELHAWRDGVSPYSAAARAALRDAAERKAKCCLDFL